jgi:hypothetical protein
MNNLTLKEAIESFSNLTETLQECIKSQDIHGAIALATERHDTLICLLEQSDCEQHDKVACAKVAISHLQNESKLAMAGAKKGRTEFIARKSALRAYSSMAA